MPASAGRQVPPEFGRLSRTARSAAQSTAPRDWVIVSAVPAKKPALKSAARGCRAPVSAASTLTAEAIEAAVVRA